MDNIGFTEGYIYSVHSSSKDNITTENLGFTRMVNGTWLAPATFGGAVCFSRY
jgi:hypothetical protein